VLFFILAGGYGKRAQPLSLIKPKPIFPLHGTPLINILLNGLENTGYSKGFINLHYKPDILRQNIGPHPGLSITYLNEAELSGSKILKDALNCMGEFLLVMNGDVFLDISKIPVEQMLGEVVKSGSDGALLLRKNDNPAYTAVISSDGFFKRAGSGVDIDGASLMYTGVALLGKKVVEKIDHINFFNTLAAYPFKIKTFVYDGPWMDIGSPRLYFEANAGYKRYMNIDTDDSSLSENVTISRDSIVSRCIAWENTKISGKSSLSECIIAGNLELHDAHYSNKVIYSSNGEIVALDL
jgi:NDP-sugar pyrophosphorylase family protein